MKKLTLEQALKTPDIAFNVTPEQINEINRLTKRGLPKECVAVRVIDVANYDFITSYSNCYNESYLPILVEIIEEDSLAFNSQQEVWLWLAEGNKCLWKTDIFVLIIGFKNGTLYDFTKNQQADYLEVNDYTQWTKYKEPEYITVNGFQVPKPIKELPKDLSKNWVYAPSFTAIDLAETYDNSYSSYLNTLLKREVLHLSKEAAITHAKAMLGYQE